jgi:hypothetical protein
VQIVYRYGLGLINRASDFLQFGCYDRLKFFHEGREVQPVYRFIQDLLQLGFIASKQAHFVLLFPFDFDFGFKRLAALAAAKLAPTASLGLPFLVFLFPHRAVFIRWLIAFRSASVVFAQRFCTIAWAIGSFPVLSIWSDGIFISATCLHVRN